VADGWQVEAVAERIQEAGRRGLVPYAWERQQESQRPYPEARAMLRGARP